MKLTSIISFFLILFLIGDTMKKVIVGIVVFIILDIAVLLINQLLQPEEVEEVNENTTISYGDYELFNFGNNFNVYNLKKSSDFHINVQNINLDYENGQIIIGEEMFNEVDRVYSHFAIYDNSLVVVAYQDAKKYSHLILYDAYTKELKVMDKIEDFYINIEDDIIFENVGIIVNTSKIMANKLIGTKNDICRFKDQDMIVTQTYELYYDKNTKMFNKKEVLYSINLYSYINNNNLCKEQLILFLNATKKQHKICC